VHAKMALRTDEIHPPAGRPTFTTNAARCSISGCRCPKRRLRQARGISRQWPMVPRRSSHTIGGRLAGDTRPTFPPSVDMIIAYLMGAMRGMTRWACGVTVSGKVYRAVPCRIGRGCRIRTGTVTTLRCRMPGRWIIYGPWDRRLSPHRADRRSRLGRIRRQGCSTTRRLQRICGSQSSIAPVWALCRFRHRGLAGNHLAVANGCRTHRTMAATRPGRRDQIRTPSNNAPHLRPRDGRRRCTSTRRQTLRESTIHPARMRLTLLVGAHSRVHPSPAGHSKIPYEGPVIRMYRIGSRSCRTAPAGARGATIPATRTPIPSRRALASRLSDRTKGRARRGREN
jgi:hypothetical protein